MHNNIPIDIPSHPYVLLNRTVLCNCIIEAENNFQLESIAACSPDSTNVNLEKYFVANTAFLDYLKGLIDILKVPILQNMTMQEHILPISLESDDFDKELLAAPETLRELVENYKRKELNFDKQHKILDPVEDLGKETSIFDHIASNIFIFVMALISLIITIIVLMLLCKGAKMQALITNLVMQKSVKALTEGKENCSNYEYWIIITLLILILLGIIFLIIEKAQRMPIFRKHQYSNTIKVLIFISNIKFYVPIKLCKTIGSIHLFKLTGRLQKECIMLHRNQVCDILEIDWKNVTLMVNGNVVNLPGSVIVPI